MNNFVLIYTALNCAQFGEVYFQDIESLREAIQHPDWKYYKLKIFALNKESIEHIGTFNNARHD